MKRIGRYIASYGSAFLISLVGIVLGMTVPNPTVITVVLAVLAACPVFLFLLQMLLARRYVKRIKSARVADMHSYMLRHRQEAEKTSSVMLKKLQRMRRATAVYAVAVWLLGACGAILGGVLYLQALGLLWAFVLYSGTVFYAVYSRMFKDEPIVFNEDTIHLSKKEYPTIHSLASRAAEQLGCGEEIAIILSYNCGASVVKDKNRYIIQLGIMLLEIISEEELYAILLHEFSHVSDKHRAEIREAKYHGAISNQSELHAGWMSFVTNLFVFADIRYAFHYMTYQYAVSVVNETEADRDMAKYGNVEAAASALLKLEYETRYTWESGVKNETPLYAAEILTADYLTVRLEKFKQAIEERHSDWDAMVDKEILPNNATHPTLRMRLDTLGVKSAKPIEAQSSQTYREELEKALASAEQAIYQDRKESYEKDRDEAYLQPLARVTAWEQEGTPITAEGYADIVGDLKLLGRHEDAEALCDRAMEELHENSSMYAYFMKGSALLYRYDERGMDLIYHAIEKNQNYLEEGLTVIGTFCCTTGREDALQDYRARATQLTQKNVDEDSQANFLSKNDRLTRDDMPKEMLDDILSYIHSVDCDIIQNIYLVRKTVSESFFSSVFIIHFYGGTDAQRDDIMHKIFSYLDSYPVEWQFSLFDYFEYPEIKVEKIAGSLVYSKSK